MSEIPTKIGQYEIVREVARGSMGTVHKSYGPFSRRSVTIKVAHAQYANFATEDGERFRKVFFNEAHAAGGLDHPNIVRVFGADVDGDLCYSAKICPKAWLHAETYAQERDDQASRDGSASDRRSDRHLQRPQPGQDRGRSMRRVWPNQEPELLQELHRC